MKSIANPNNTLPGRRDVGATLRTMWEFRACGELPQALTCYLKVAAAADLDLTESLTKQAEALLAQSISKTDALDFLLFRPSELRFQNRIAESQRSTEEVATIARRMGLPHHFQLLFQRGLNGLVQSHFGAALNDFTLAVGQARCPREEMSSRLNSILCLESMGYDFAATFMAFLADWQRGETSPAPWMASIRQQLLPLQMRQAFARGDTKALRKLSHNADVSRQGAYYAILIGELPYFSWLQPTVSTTLKRSLTQLLGTYQTHFRLGTLQGSLVRADFNHELRIGDKIERFYFWVWRWLTHPEPEALERISLWWEHLSQVFPLHDVGRDEFLLLENAARWLGLFAGFEDQSIRNRLARFTSHCATPAVLLDYEARLIAYVFSIRDGLPASMLSDEWKNLLAHPAHALDGFSLPKIVAENFSGGKTPSDPAVASLRSFVQSLSCFSRRTSSKDSIEIDLLRQELSVVDGKGSRTVCNNRALVSLMLAGRSRSTVSIYEVLEACFGIHRFDPVAHDPKLSQLVGLANRTLAPYFSLSRKGDQIRFELRQGKGVIRLVGGPVHTAQLYPWRERLSSLARRSEANSGKDATSNPLEKPRDGKIEPTPGTWVNRQQFELMLKSSRATTCRRLADWVDQGLLHKRGIGRSTQYRLTQDLLNSKHFGALKL